MEESSVSNEEKAISVDQISTALGLSTGFLLLLDGRETMVTNQNVKYDKNYSILNMVTVFDEIVYAVSYLALSLVSLNCLTIYVMQVGSDARSYGYGIFIINAVYGVGGAISTVADHLSHVQVIFYVAQVAFVLPLLATEVWIQHNIMPKQEELVYVPFVLGLLPFFSFIMMGHIRIDLIELCLVYCCVSICYVGCSSKDYMVVSASLLFYLAYNMHYRGKVKISNVLFILFVVCSLGSICPNCIENWMKKSDFPFENNRRFK